MIFVLRFCSITTWPGFKMPISHVNQKIPHCDKQGGLKNLETNKGEGKILYLLYFTPYMYINIPPTWLWLWSGERHWSVFAMLLVPVLHVVMKSQQYDHPVKVHLGISAEEWCQHQGPAGQHWGCTCFEVGLTCYGQGCFHLPTELSGHHLPFATLKKYLKNFP